MTTARFEPGAALSGDYVPPPDKSISHRAALIGTMCEEPVTVHGFLDAADTRSTLEAVERALMAGDVAGWNDRAREDRRTLLEADVPGGAVHELRLTVPNRPGIVAQVALALGKAGVNIVDMALAPAADMRSGAMTLWIAGDGQAAQAAELIAELGFPVAEQ